MAYSQFWQSTLNAYQLGRNGSVSYDKYQTLNFTGFNYTGTVFYSTSHAHLVMPQVMYSNIMKYLLYGKTAYQLDDYVLSSCDVSSYNSIFVRLQDTWFEIRPSTFVLVNATYQIQSTNNDIQTYCTIGILAHTFDYVILGAPFMKNYYMIFDVENDKMGISNLNSTSQMFQGGLPINNTVTKKPTGGGTGGKGTDNNSPTQLDNLVVYGILIIIILLLTLFIVLLIFAIWFFGFRKTSNETKSPTVIGSLRELGERLSES